MGYADTPEKQTRRQEILSTLAALAIQKKIAATGAPFYAVGRYLTDIENFGKIYTAPDLWLVSGRSRESKHPDDNIENYRVNGLHPVDALRVAMDELRMAMGVDELERIGKRAGRRHRKKRGAPVIYDPRNDAKIFAAWSTGIYNTYAECAKQMGAGHSEESIKLAIDRHSQRLRKQSARGE